MAKRSALWLFAGVVVVAVVGYYAFAHRKVCGYVASVHYATRTRGRPDVTPFIRAA
jgi:hypothetical protein